MKEKNKINLGIILSIILIIIVTSGVIIISSQKISPTIAYRFNYDEKNFEEENIEILLFPDENNVNKVLEKIDSAKKEINCAFRSFNHKELEKILIEKEKEIKVRLFVNSDYLGKTDFYLPFVNFEKREGKGMMHNNYCIIDENIVITGSLIFNANTINQNIHDALIINSEELAKEFNKDFWRLYNREGNKEKEEGEFIKINDDTEIKAFFCPVNDCEEIMTREIQDGEKIRFATYAFTNEKIKKEIEQKEIQGVVDYYGLTEDSILFDELKGVKMSKIIENVHTKLFVIDNEITITGTMNPSFFGTKLNQENMLIIKNKKINEFYTKLINYLYSKSTN
jgi:phosphatidylserine/phosphatidylglycerophosphate/cardiolipin synthase-like enzyme